MLEIHGYTVKQAADGNQALEILDQHSGNIDLLMTDVVIPGMSGRELATLTVARFPRIKVLFISGYTDNAIRHHGILQADTAFLQKPATLKTTLHKIHEILSDR